MAQVDLSGPELEAVNWVLAGLRGGPMPEEPREPLAPNWRRSREQMWPELARFGSMLAADFEITAGKRFDETGELMVELDLVPSSGKRSVLRCFIEPEPPHRIRTLGIGWPLAEGYTARAARPSDAPVLAALETQVPIESNRSTVAIDRGSHYWDHMQLMESNVTVAERDGEIVAAMASVFIPLLANAGERSLCFLHHGRVHPDHQGRGLSRALTARSMEHDLPRGEDAGAVFFIADSNHSALAPWPDELRWSTRPERLLFDVAELAAVSKGADAAKKDAGRVISLLNTCHQDEGLFLPYSEDRLEARLTRAPSAYSWAHLRVQDDAVIGVGSATERRRHTDPDGSTRESRRAPILDFGFVGERGWESFEALLRGTCSELVGSGVTHLALFSSPGSPGYSRLRALSSAQEPYVLITLGMEEPAGSGGTGLYIDHLYF